MRRHRSRLEQIVEFGKPGKKSGLPGNVRVHEGEIGKIEAGGYSAADQGVLAPGKRRLPFAAPDTVVIPGAAALPRQHNSFNSRKTLIDLNKFKRISLIKMPDFIMADPMEPAYLPGDQQKIDFGYGISHCATHR